MKLKFSTKIFFTFLLFGTIVLMFLTYFEYKMISTKMEENSSQKFISNTNIIDSKIKNMKIKTKNIIDTISKLQSFKKMDKNSLEDSIKAIANSHLNILEVLVLDENLNYLVKVLKDKKTFDGQNNIKFISQISLDRFYFSNIDLIRYKKEIQVPLQHIMLIAKKVDNYTILVKINVNSLINLLQNFLYVLDNEKNVIYDKAAVFSWSKYYYPNINLKEKLPYFDFINYFKETKIDDGFIYRSLDIDKNNFIIVVNSLKKTDLKSFINTYLYEILFVIFLTLITSLVLSLILTVPISSINKKLLSEKDNLYNSIKKKSLELDESLQLIDQHLMYLKMDKNFIIEDISSYFCKVYGYQKEELLGQHYSILYSKERYKQIKNVIFNKLYKERIWKGEILAKRKNGEEYWVESCIRAEFKGDKIVSYTIVRKDISDNKKLEKLYEDLYYQIEQLNAIFQNVYSGITLIDLEGNIKKSNLAFCNILGYKTDEINSLNIFDFIQEGSKKLLEKLLDELKEFGSISDMEFIFLTKNEEEIYLNLSLKMLPDKTNIVVVVNSLEDKRKLQELNQNLEQRVKEEVRKNIEKDKAHQEEKLKNVKLTSIGTLAAGITHEINTPLTYLKGNFEMLQMDIDYVQDENLKKEMIDSCSKITDAITRISVIIESMREMSQSSSEAKEKTNIFATLVTSLTMAYNVSKQIVKMKLNGNEFKLTNIKKDMLEIFTMVQKQRIEQVWIIILNNALDELKNTGTYETRELNIDVYEESDEVVVKFSDNAGGIKPEILPNIFEPFTSSKEHSGMGIGLNIAKKIVDEQNGVIKAYNSEIGAVFEVRLQKAN